MGAWTVYLILTFNCDHRHLTQQNLMSRTPSLDACHSLDASPARMTRRTDSDIMVAAVEEGHTPLDHELPPRKRQKTEDEGDQATSASSLGAPGSALLDLPLDVLLELSHDPASHLELTILLLDPHPHWIWRASYANTDHGLPPAPDDMTVPQFLSLLIDQFCDVCHASPDPKDPLDRIKRIPVHTNPVCDSTQMAREEDMTRFPMVREIQGYFGPQYPLYKIFPASEPYYARINQRLKDLNIDVDEPQEFKKQLSTRLKTPPIPPYYNDKRDKYFPTPVYSTPIEVYDLVREAQPLQEEDWSTIREWLLDAAKAEKKRQVREGRYSAFKEAYSQFMDRKSHRRKCLLPSLCT
ncbi:hypothetical protein GGG16DRAFT_118754 [Schizophyllum commune]